jgi:hypothetical protein
MKKKICWNRNLQSPGVSMWNQNSENFKVRGEVMESELAPQNFES